MSETPPAAIERLGPVRVVRHILVGAGAGFAAGGVAAIGALLWGGSAFRWAGVLAALAILSVPAGMILGAGVALADYQSRSGVEWALVGAAAAALFVASLGQLRLRPFVIALTLFVLSGWVTARATAWALGMRPRESHPTGTTLVVYGATTCGLAAVYWWIFAVVLATID